MSKVNFIIVTFLFIPVLVLAQTEELVPNILEIGEQKINYSEVVTIDDGVLYYDKNTTDEGALMVASSHDTNGDDLVDVWFVYDINQNVIVEAYDQTNDKEPDLFLRLDASGEVVSVSGENAEKFTREVAVSFIPEPISAVNQDEDLVGDTSDITITENDNNWVFFVILLIAGSGLYLFWKRQK